MFRSAVAQLVCAHFTMTRSTLAGGWDDKTSKLQKMLIVRSLRQDRVTFCVTSFIIDNLGASFVEPPALDMKAVGVPPCWTILSAVPRL